MKYITYDQLPLMLNAEDIQAVMNISRAGAYQLMGSVSSEYVCTRCLKSGKVERV